MKRKTGCTHRRRPASPLSAPPDVNIPLLGGMAGGEVLVGGTAERGGTRAFASCAPWDGRGEAGGRRMPRRGGGPGSATIVLGTGGGRRHGLRGGADAGRASGAGCAVAVGCDGCDGGGDEEDGERATRRQGWWRRRTRGTGLLCVCLSRANDVTQRWASPIPSAVIRSSLPLWAPRAPASGGSSSVRAFCCQPQALTIAQLQLQQVRPTRRSSSPHGVTSYVYRA